MATEGDPAEDVPLFDAAAVPRSGDTRSVGELLVDVDYLARQLLLDVSAADAAGLVRGWPALARAAGDFWDALPAVRTTDALVAAGEPPREVEGDQQVARVLVETDSVAEAVGTARWPRPGRRDPRMRGITESLGQAASLVRRYGGDVPALEAGPRADILAARARVMHAVYVAAHAVNRATQDLSRQMLDEARATPATRELRSAPSGVAQPLTHWVERFSRIERYAGYYVTGRYAEAITGQAPSHLGDPSRVRTALVTWDAHARRVLAGSAAAADVAVVAQVQGGVAGASLRILDAGSAGTVDERVVSAVEAVGHTWSRLAGRWSDLVSPTAVRDPQLLLAAGEVRSALRELTHDGNTQVEAPDLRQHPGLEQALVGVLEATLAAPELAHAVSRQAAREDLTGPAVKLSRRAANDTEAASAGHGAEESVVETVWVSVEDITVRRTVPVPAPVLDSLRRASDVLEEQTSFAASTAATVDVSAFRAARRAQVVREAVRRPIAQAVAQSRDSAPSLGERAHPAPGAARPDREKGRGR